MKRISILIIAWLSIFFLIACSKEYTPYDEIDFASIKIDETDIDYLCIKNAMFFAESGVGYAGEIPDEIYAFGRLIKKENALDYFYKLESEADNEGKLYALCGIYYLDYNNYYYLMEKYGSSEETVSYMAGCIWMEDYPINELIKRDDNGVVRLENNTDTIDKWLKRNSTTSFIEDFYGGSIPNMVMQNSNVEFQ